MADRRTTGIESVAVFRETLDRLLAERTPSRGELLEQVVDVLVGAGRPMTLTEIAEATGLSVAEVRRTLPGAAADDDTVTVSVRPARRASVAVSGRTRPAVAPGRRAAAG